MKHFRRSSLTRFAVFCLFSLGVEQVSFAETGTTAYAPRDRRASVGAFIGYSFFGSTGVPFGIHSEVKLHPYLGLEVMAQFRYLPNIGPISSGSGNIFDVLPGIGVRFHIPTIEGLVMGARLTAWTSYNFGGPTASLYYWSGLTGGGFVAYDHMIHDRMSLGGELGMHSFGGGTLQLLGFFKFWI